MDSCQSSGWSISVFCSYAARYIVAVYFPPSYSSSCGIIVKQHFFCWPFILPYWWYSCILFPHTTWWKTNSSHLLLYTHVILRVCVCCGIDNNCRRFCFLVVANSLNPTLTLNWHMNPSPISVSFPYTLVHTTRPGIVEEKSCRKVSNVAIVSVPYCFSEGNKSLTM